MKLLKYIFILVLIGLALFSIVTVIENRNPDSEVIDAVANPCVAYKDGPLKWHPEIGRQEVQWHPPMRCGK